MRTASTGPFTDSTHLRMRVAAWHLGVGVAETRTNHQRGHYARQTAYDPPLRRRDHMTCITHLLHAYKDSKGVSGVSEITRMPRRSSHWRVNRRLRARLMMRKYNREIRSGVILISSLVSYTQQPSLTFTGAVWTFHTRVVIK